VHAEREALRLVEFWLTRPLCRQDALDRLRNSPGIRDEVRRFALRLADGYRDGPQFDAASWAVVRKADEPTDRYLRALAWAQMAHHLDPDNGAYRTTLGIAQYRAGQYHEAVATLTPKTQPTAPLVARLNPTDLAFLVMAHHQLGQTTETEGALERLRVLQRQWQGRGPPWWIQDADVLAFLREVEVLVRGAQAPPF
jgi:hypothetical protein